MFDHKTCLRSVIMSNLFVSRTNVVVVGRNPKEIGSARAPLLKVDVADPLKYASSFPT